MSLRKIIKSNSKILIFAAVLGVIFGLQYSLASELEVKEVSARFMVEWANALFGICFSGAIGFLFRMEKVRKYFSGSFDQLLLLMTCVLGFSTIWIGLTIVFTTYVRFRTTEFSHLGFHCLVFGFAVATGFITATIYRKST